MSKVIGCSLATAGEEDTVMSTRPPGNDKPHNASSLLACKPVVVMLTLLGLLAMSTIMLMPCPTASAQVEPRGNITESAMNLTRVAPGQIVGTTSLIQSAKDFLNDTVNGTTFFDAASEAKSQISNSTVIAGQLDDMQGYLVYNITLARVDSGSVYTLDIDPIDADVLYISSGSSIAETKFQSALKNMNHTLIEASVAAENAITNGTVIAASSSIPLEGNTLRYNITVMDKDDGALYLVAIDATTGKIMSISAGKSLGYLYIEGVLQSPTVHP